MMKRTVMLCSVLFEMILAECGDIDEKNTREVKSGADVASESEEATETEKEEVEEKEKPIGTRSNPLSYVMVKVKGFLKEFETEDDSLYFSSMNFNFVSNDGEVYDWASAVIPNELSKELYNGGTAEGYIMNQVKVGDDFKISYDSSKGSPVFFLVQ